VIKDISLIKVTPPYEKKKISLRVEIDSKNFPPCDAKEVEKWSYSKMKTLKYVVHVSHKGEITVKEVI
jgi:hypothetical protein